jgi:hypothetical protein
MSLRKSRGGSLEVQASRDCRQINDHLGQLLRGTVKETLNALLDAEAEALCGVGSVTEDGSGGPVHPYGTSFSPMVLRMKSPHAS